MFNNKEFAKRMLKNPFYRKNIKVIGQYANGDEYRVRFFNKEFDATGEELRELELI